jgi:hypothetical protein
MDSETDPHAESAVTEKISGLSWLGFLCFVIANGAEAAKDVNIHDSHTLLIAIGAAGLSIGGLCLHPPWAK